MRNRLTNEAFIALSLLVSLLWGVFFSVQAQPEHMASPEFKALFERADRYMIAEEWSSTLQETEEVMAQNSADNDVLIMGNLYQGLCYMRRAQEQSESVQRIETAENQSLDYQRAIKGFQSCIQLSPTEHEDYLTLISRAHYQIGRCYFGLRNYDKAIEVFDEVISKYSDRKEARLALSRIREILEKKNEYDKILTYSETLLKKYPKTELARNALYEAAVYYKRQGNFSAAIEKYQQIVNLFPDDDLAVVAKKNIDLLKERIQKDSEQQ